MSFFGLTAFGPENLIKSTLVNSNGFTLFYDDDYKIAFEKITKKQKTPGKLCISDVKEFLTLTYNFPPLDDEVEVFVKNSGKAELSDFLTWEEVLMTLKVIREKLKNTADLSQKYNSFQKYYDDTYKHRRKETNPYTVFKSPATSGQNYGFYKFTKHNLNDVRFPKINCEETKYFEFIVRTGKNFMK